MSQIGSENLETSRIQYAAKLVIWIPYRIRLQIND